jgi:putative transposase
METDAVLKHTKWDCKYHVVFIPKGRRKALYEKLRQALGPLFRELVQQCASRILEGHHRMDHLHRLISIPPKLPVSQVVGYIKRKSGIYMARQYMGKPRNFWGEHFWVRGYFVSAVGRDEKTIREYIQKQEEEDRRLDQMELFK